MRHAFHAPRPSPLSETRGLSRRAYFLASEVRSWTTLREAGEYYERLAQLMEEARHSVIFVGWQIDSRLPMPGPGGRPERLKDKVLRLAREHEDLHFYFLMWDHAYFYCLERETLQGRVWDDIHPRVHFVFDNRHPFGGSHHEKIALVDGKTAFCGGIDLCDDRWDTPAHWLVDRRRSLSLSRDDHGPYHDLTLELTGPVCSHLHAHVSSRWRRISSVPFPSPRPRPLKPRAGQRTYLSRTRAEIEPGGPGRALIREIEFLCKDLVSLARRRILIEAQYYWSESFNDALIARLLASRGQELELTIVLADLSRLGSPVRLMAYHGMKLLARLAETARASGTRLLIAMPEVRAGAERRPIYVHSKLIVVDDRFLSVGSANLASRAFRLDSELTVTLEAGTPRERADIEAFTARTLAHWNLPSRAHALNDEHNANPGVHLRAIEPAREAERLRALHPILTRIPWAPLFDPKVPWFYPLKRRVRHWSRTRAGMLTGAFLLVGALGAWSAAGLSLLLASNGAPPAMPWAAALLSTSWAIPFPFVPACLCLAAVLGGGPAAAAGVAGLWVTAILGYSLGRIFPSTAYRFYRRTAPPWLPRRLGLRSFPQLVRVLIDPRISLRSKIAYQGLYCVHVPWFALANLAVLPGALTLACRAIGALAGSPGR